MEQHPQIKLESPAPESAAGKTTAMSALWQQQQAEVTRLQAELDDARIRPGAGSLESVRQLSETLEAAREQLRACGPEAVPPAAQSDVLAYDADCAAPTCPAITAGTIAPVGEEGNCSADAAMMTAAEKKKVMRAATKDLYAKLDALLPPTGRAHIFDVDALGGQAPSSRGPGRSGRSLNEILHDAVHCMKMHHKRHGSTPSPKLRKGLRGPGRRVKKAVGAAAHGQRTVADSGAPALMPPSAATAECRMPPHLEPGVTQMSMLSSQSMLLVEVAFPECRFTSMGAGFLQLIQSRVSDEKNTFSTKQVGNMMTNMSLFHFIHPSDVEILRMYILGGYWTYGTIIDLSQTIAVRLAPCKPSADGTCAPERDIWLRLVGLDPAGSKGLFVCDRC